MTNSIVFRSDRKFYKPTNTVNEAGGSAYLLESREALAQFACTCCFNNVYYSSVEEQLDKILELCKNVDSEFIAKTAIYAREQSNMKDTPAFLCAVLASREDGIIYLNKIFSRLINNSKMLCNFVQIIRSGVTGRKSFGTAIRRLIRNWLNERDGDTLFMLSIGRANPSIADIIKMVHPNPSNSQRSRVFDYLLHGLDNNKKMTKLPDKIKQFENFKSGKSDNVPNIPFQALTSLDLSTSQWTEIALNASWNTVRMNLNTFKRHGVLANQTVVSKLAEKLRDAELIRKSKIFPYALMTTYNAAIDIPLELKSALQDALEIATENVPILGMNVAICVDTSGSMQQSITGNRKGSTSSTTCVQVAGLIASSILRTNPNTLIVPYDTEVRDVQLNPRDTILTNAQKLSLSGGGTNSSSALKFLLDQSTIFDLIIYVSDNQSWFGPETYQSEGMSGLWTSYKNKNPNARLICIDLQPYESTQLETDKNVLNIGGWSDSLWDTIYRFASREQISFDKIVNEVEI